MKAKDFSIKEALKYGWEAWRKNIWFFLGVILLAWVVQFTPNYIRPLVKSRGLGLVLGLIGWLVDSAVALGLINVALELRNKGKSHWTSLYKRLDLWPKYFWTSIVYSLIIFFGLLLLIVPGVIWAIKYQFYGYAVVDKGLGMKQALERSKLLTEGVKLKLFWLGLVLLGVNFVGALAFVVGLLVTVPVTLMALVYVYYQLSPEQEEGAVL
jgi:uncharacterized membrane protein